MNSTAKELKTQALKKIEEATELIYLNTNIKRVEMALSNTRTNLKSLMKEKQLLINIKKSWKA